MNDPRPPQDQPPAPAIDPPNKQAPVREPPGDDAPPEQAPPAEKPNPDKATPAERVQKLRVGVRLVWWSAVSLTVLFVALGVWLAVGRGDPFALFFIVLAALCAAAGYGALQAIRRRPV